jgi:hypothetical protein
MRKHVSASDSDDCPPGFALCKEGLCAPMCDHVTPPAFDR